MDYGEQKTLLNVDIFLSFNTMDVHEINKSFWKKDTVLIVHCEEHSKSLQLNKP